MKAGLIGINSIHEEDHFLKIKDALKNNLKIMYAPNISDIIPISKSHSVETSSTTNDLFSRVDIVYFAKSLKTNYDFALNALKNSCHIFIEDISELSLDEIKQLYKLAFEARSKIQLKLSKVFTPEFLDIKDEIIDPQVVDIINHYPSFLRKKDYYYEILNNLNFANSQINSSIKKTNIKVIPYDYNHYSLIHIRINYDNGSVVDMKFNNIADDEENYAVFYESTKNTKIDFINHFAVQLQFENGSTSRTELPTKTESAFNIEILNFINACKNLDIQSISESPTELKIIQATEDIMEQLSQTRKPY